MAWILNYVCANVCWLKITNKELLNRMNNCPKLKKGNRAIRVSYHKRNLKTRFCILIRKKDFYRAKRMIKHMSLKQQPVDKGFLMFIECLNL